MTKSYATRRRLSNRLIRISSGVILLSLLAIVVVFALYSNSQARQDLTNDLKVLSNVLGNRSIASLIFEDPRAAKRNLESTTFRDSIVSACIYRADGSLFADFIVQGSRHGCSEELNALEVYSWSEDSLLGVSAPIIDSGEQVGSIAIRASTDGIYESLRRALLTVTVAFSVIVFIALYLIKHLIVKALRPLTSLHDTALTISNDPYSKLRAKRAQDDEVGRLVQVFNNMLDTLDNENLALLSSEGRFRTLAENSPVGIYQMNADREFVYTNQRWHELTHMAPHCSRKEYLARVDGSDQEMLMSLVDKVQSKREAKVVEYHFQPPDGTNKLIFMEHIAPIFSQVDDSHEIVGFIGSLMDISDLKHAQMELENLAFYDPLTNLPNRRFFRDHLQYVMAGAKGDNSRLAIMMLDLDNFKKVNDTLGHDAGDELLSILGERLRGMVSQQDVVSRMGGDEFMILLKDVDIKSSIKRIADRVLQTVRRPMTIRDHDIEVSASIGIAIYPEDAANPEELIRNADLALYLSKESGRNRLSFFSRRLETLVNEKVYMERKLREAIKSDALSFYVQPQWSLHDGRLVSGEVLMRWIDPDEGFISPARFIPVAEEVGLILEMGEWLIDKVFESIASHRKQLELLGIRTLAINLSARQFFSSNLVLKIDSALKTYDIDPSMIELELTESAVIEDIEMAVHIMERLKALGCRLAIDDFGTGYSSLSYLKRFPIDSVKIDQSFISDIPKDQNDVEISAAIIAMGHNLGLEVVAEGVETQEQMDFLVRQQCDYAQGYMIAKPMPFEDIFENVTEINQRMAKQGSQIKRSAG